MRRHARRPRSASLRAIVGPPAPRPAASVRRLRAYARAPAGISSTTMMPSITSIAWAKPRPSTWLAVSHGSEGLNAPIAVRTHPSTVASISVLRRPRRSAPASGWSVTVRSYSETGPSSTPKRPSPIGFSRTNPSRGLRKRSSSCASTVDSVTTCVNSARERRVQLRVERGRVDEALDAHRLVDTVGLVDVARPADDGRDAGLVAHEAGVGRELHPDDRPRRAEHLGVGLLERRDERVVEVELGRIAEQVDVEVVTQLGIVDRVDARAQAGDGVFA